MRGEYRKLGLKSANSSLSLHLGAFMKQTKNANPRGQISRDLLFLMFLHGCLFWAIAVLNLPLAHDTMINFQMFATIYSEFFLSGQFPLWLPFSSQGITADFAYAFTFTPVFYVAVFLGKLFLVNDTLLLFRFGLYAEEALFLFGLYRLSSLFYNQRITPIIISITGVLSVSWAVQIHWNFHLIYLFPLLLYFSSRFLLGDGLENVAYALILLTLGALFYPQIFIAATLCVFVVIWLVLLRPSWRQLFHFKYSVFCGCAIISVAFFVAFLNLQFVMHVIDGMQSFSTLRQPDGSVELETFLTYGGHVTLVKFMEFVYGAPVRFAFVAYCGLFTILFICFALISARSLNLYVFIFSTMFVLLFSLGASGYVAEMAYKFFPEMDKFRHIGFVTPVAKVLLVISSGFGIDQYMKNSSKFFFNAFIFTTIAIVLGLIFLSIDTSHDWQYAYVVDSNLVIPFHFHWMQLGIVFAFCIMTFAVGNRVRSGRLAAVTVGILLLFCVLLGMGSYKFFLEWHSPAMKSPWIEHWQSLRHAYDVHPFLYSSCRQREGDDNSSNQLSKMAVWGARNSLGYGSLPVDLCFPIHRVDMASSAFDTLIKTRLGVPNFQSPQEYFTIGRVEKDAVLMKAIGCDAPKLYLSQSPVLVENFEEVRQVVAASKALYEKPVIQVSCGSQCGKLSSRSAEFLKDVVDISRFSANQLTANVNVPDGLNWYLVYLDSYHPRWKARVDGAVVPILPANIAFKAIMLTPGRHEVEFTFTGGSRWTSVTLWVNYILSVAIFFGLIAKLCRYVMSGGGLSGGK